MKFTHELSDETLLKLAGAGCALHAAHLFAAPRSVHDLIMADVGSPSTTWEPLGGRRGEGILGGTAAPCTRPPPLLPMPSRACTLHHSPCSVCRDRPATTRPGGGAGSCWAPAAPRCSRSLLQRHPRCGMSPGRRQCKQLGSHVACTRFSTDEQAFHGMLDRNAGRMATDNCNRRRQRRDAVPPLPPCPCCCIGIPATEPALPPPRLLSTQHHAEDCQVRPQGSGGQLPCDRQFPRVQWRGTCARAAAGPCLAALVPPCLPAVCGALAPRCVPDHPKQNPFPTPLPRRLVCRGGESAAVWLWARRCWARSACCVAAPTAAAATAANNATACEPNPSSHRPEENLLATLWFSRSTYLSLLCEAMVAEWAAALGVGRGNADGYNAGAEVDVPERGAASAAADEQHMPTQEASQAAGGKGHSKQGSRPFVGRPVLDSNVEARAGETESQEFIDQGGCTPGARPLVIIFSGVNLVGHFRCVVPEDDEAAQRRVLRCPRPKSGPGAALGFWGARVAINPQRLQARHSRKAACEAADQKGPVGNQFSQLGPWPCWQHKALEQRLPGRFIHGGQAEAPQLWHMRNCRWQPDRPLDFEAGESLQHGQRMRQSCCIPFRGCLSIAAIDRQVGQPSQGGQRRWQRRMEALIQGKGSQTACQRRKPCLARRSVGCAKKC